jgi:hypothetical protein
MTADKGIGRKSDAGPRTFEVIGKTELVPGNETGGVMRVPFL